MTGKRRFALALLASTVLIAGAVVVLSPAGDSDGTPSPKRGFKKHYDLGLAHLMAGKVSVGITDLQRAIEIDPRQPSARYHLARAYLKTGDPEKALETMNHLLEDPDQRRYAEAMTTLADFYSLRGGIHEQTGDFERSKADFAKAVEVKPESGVLYDQLCRIHLAIGEPEEALRAGLEALDLGFRTYESIFRVGDACKRLGWHDEAQRHFRESIWRNAGYTRAYQGLAQSLRKVGRNEEARRMFDIVERLARADDYIQAYRRTLQAVMIDNPNLDPRQRESIESYARHCFEHGKYIRVSECMTVLLRIYPNRPDYHASRGIAHAQLLEEKDAERDLRRALELSPDTVPVINELALLLAGAEDSEVRDPAESVVWAERARALGYGGGEVLAVALDAVGQTDKASRLLGWKFEEGRAWESLREVRLKQFHDSLLEKRVEGLPPEKSP